MLGNSYSYLFGPLVITIALGVIVLMCRWVFSTSHRDDRTARRLAKLASHGDYGLLVPVATARTADDAAMLRSVLGEAGIRSTSGEAADGSGTEVLVFRADVGRARELVSN